MTETGARWSSLETWLKRRFGREPGLESILFLVGVQSRGIGYTPQLEKDEKQDLIMLGSHVVLSVLGLCDPPTEVGDGFSGIELPRLSIAEQESLLKLGVLRYFEQFMDTP